MRFVHVIGTILVSSSFAALATTYVPAGEFGGWQHGGYSDVIVNSNTAIVKFSGNKDNSSQQAHIYLLYRCAEVTLQQGYQYFVVVSTSGSKENVQLRTKTVTQQMYPSTSFIGNDEYTEQEVVSYKVTPSKVDNCTASANCSPSAVAVIKMFNDGDLPTNLPRVYSAEDVIGHYGYMIN